jgi:V/A-type H+-transporting ATPase subunit E
MRKKVLAAKQEMIDAVFMGVLQRIESMPDDEYKDIIMSMLLASPLYGDEEVVFSACDPHNLDQGFLNKVNEMLVKDGRKGQLRLSSDRGQFKAGFILRREGVEINSTFESILGTLRNDMEPLLAEILFA